MFDEAINNSDAYDGTRTFLMGSSRKGRLEKFQVHRAEAYIKEMHPIKNTDFDVAFPKVGCFCKLFMFCIRCCRSSKDEDEEEEEDQIEETGLREVLLNQNKALTTNK